MKILKTEAQYEEALHQIDSLMNAVSGSQEEQTLKLLSLLAEKYEEEHYPIDLPDAAEAIKFRMEQEVKMVGRAAVGNKNAIIHDP